MTPNPFYRADVQTLAGPAFVRRSCHSLGRMSSTPPHVSKFRRTWLAVLVGCGSLALLFFAHLLLQPYLISAAVPAAGAGPRASAGGWANSGVWLAAVAACTLALVAIGYSVGRLSPPTSRGAPIALLLLLVAYVFFAQFPATHSVVRIAVWAVSVPASFFFGVWLTRRAQSAA